MKRALQQGFSSRSRCLLHNLGSVWLKGKGVSSFDQRFWELTEEAIVILPKHNQGADCSYQRQ